MLLLIFDFDIIESQTSVIFFLSREKYTQFHFDLPSRKPSRFPDISAGYFLKCGRLEHRFIRVQCASQGWSGRL